MKMILTFAPQDTGKMLDELKYEQINSNARFIFFRPIKIQRWMKIEFDTKRGTFHLLTENDQRYLIDGKWDR